MCFKSLLFTLGVNAKRKEEELVKRKTTVEIIEELADRITEELQNQLGEDEDEGLVEETFMGSDSEGDLLSSFLWRIVGRKKDQLVPH